MGLAARRLVLPPLSSSMVLIKSLSLSFHFCKMGLALPGLQG